MFFLVPCSIALMGLVMAYEAIRQERIKRKLDRLAKTGLSHRQLIARGLI